MIWTTQQVTAYSKYDGNTLTDEMLLDFAKILWENNLITSELIFDEDKTKVKLKATCVKTTFEENKKQDNVKENSEDDNASTKKLPWYKRIFEN
jgi:hypothetical protein